MITFDPKHPADDDSYGLDWSPILAAGETITSSSWSVIGPNQLLLVGAGVYQPSFSGTQTTVWLSGGTDGVTYTLENSITTSSSPSRPLTRRCAVPVSNDP